MRQIIKILPKERQTMLFSATQTTKVEDLARISFQNKPLYVGVDDGKSVSTREGLEQVRSLGQLPFNFHPKITHHIRGIA